MITVATETSGTPVFLISRLAWHTRNLEADPRASILFTTEQAHEGDPLALGRVSAMGVAEKIDDARARERFLARHPEAAGYAGFADFAFWRLNIEKAHYVGGFGRIGTLPGESLLRRADAAAAWDAQIPRLLAQCPPGMASALAAGHNAHGAGDWRIAACDPEGCDLIAGDRVHHLAFPQPVEDVNQIPEVLQRLASGKATSS
jgi:putative heme iron utilization protein